MNEMYLFLLQSIQNNQNVDWFIEYMFLIFIFNHICHVLSSYSHEPTDDFRINNNTMDMK